jgi:hypothetical protein
MQQHYPKIAMDAEDAYRRERAAEQFRHAHGSSRRPGRGLAERLRWHRRRDRTTD